MDYTALVLSVLASVFTGGVMILFIENLHITSFIWTRYESIMTPFFHKLTCMIKYIIECHSAIEIKNPPNQILNKYKQQMDYFHKYTHNNYYISGRDIPLDYFSATELNKLCEQINNIWYFGDRNKSSITDNTYNINNVVYNDTVKHYLVEIFQDDSLIQKQITIPHINDMCSKFYVELYQPIKNIFMYYEIWNEQNTCFKELSIVSIAFCISIFALMLLWPNIPHCFLNIMVILSILLFCGSLYYLIQIDKFSRKMFR